MNYTMLESCKSHTKQDCIFQNVESVVEDLLAPKTDWCMASATI